MNSLRDYYSVFLIGDPGLRFGRCARIRGGQSDRLISRESEAGVMGEYVLLVLEFCWVFLLVDWLW